MSETLISVENVSKKFCRNLKRSLWYGLLDLKDELRGSRDGGRDSLRPDEFWAVKDVSFELKRGECLGLIGHNGAGKTTLLRILNGLIKLDTGRIEMRGRLGALIALGAGFNPVLTGRENIYTNAAVLGLSRSEVDAKFDEVIEFSELAEFIDSPVRNYSSGMSVRLGFAVAAIMIEPDVLFLDEVLAVGDIGFVVKCLNRVRQLTEKSAVIFVSHNMQFVSSFCTRVMVMDHGRVLQDSLNPAAGIDRYYSLVKYEQQVSGNGGAELHEMRLIVDGSELIASEPGISQGVVAKAVLEVRLHGAGREAICTVYIHDEAQSPVVCYPLVDETGQPVRLISGENRMEISLGTLELNAGKYSFVVALRDAMTSETLVRAQGVRPFRILSDKTHWGKIVKPVTPAISSVL